jgi:hypothetical protein
MVIKCAWSVAADESAYSSRFKTETHTTWKKEKKSLGRGFAHFSGTFRSVVKLSPANLKAYHKYWRAVAHPGVQVNKAGGGGLRDRRNIRHYDAILIPEDLSLTDMECTASSSVRNFASE